MMARHVEKRWGWTIIGLFVKIHVVHPIRNAMEAQNLLTMCAKPTDSGRVGGEGMLEAMAVYFSFLTLMHADSQNMSN